MKQLLDYILKMPNAHDSHNRAYKFPFLASEILSADVIAIYDLFFNEPKEVEI